MYSINQLSEMCEHLNKQEVSAAKAQRESIKYKQCEYLKNKIGESFRGVISSVNKFGVFIEIIENGCDTMVSEDWLKSNNLFVDEENYCINDFNNGDIYRLGDEVITQVTKVNMTRKQIDSILILD